MGKRKSTDKSSESPLNKNIKPSPNKMKNPPQTPIQQKPAVFAQSERKKDFKKENNKRKSLPPKLVNGDEETSAKKPKIEPFTGTVNLFTEVQKGNSPAINNKKLKKENKTKGSPASKQTSNKKNTNAGVISSDANETDRTKARLEKLKHLRITSKDRFKTKLTEAASGNDVAIAQVVAHITRLEQQKTGLSKSAKRRLGTLRRVLRNAGISEESLEIMKNSQKQQTNQIVQKNAAEKETKQDSKKNSLQKQKNKNANVKQQKITKKEESSNEDESEESADNLQQSEIVNIKAKKVPQILSKKVEEESSENEDSEDESMDEEDENSVNNEMIEDEAEEDDNNEREEESENSEDDDDGSNQNNEVDSESSNESAENDEDNNEESSGDEDDDDGGNNVLEIKKNLLNKQTKLKSNLNKNENEGSAKSRYVLFVGNLPYDVTRQDITEHFSKAGQIRDIRIPLEKETNKPRGFAFVEMPDQTCYEKALSLHQTFIKGRKINVLYTQGGKKNSEEKRQNIKAKNFKLQAMRQQGKLAGNVKESQKRSFRRTKK